MPARTPLDRLKQARLVQVLVVYLGASWVVLQLVDTLVGLLSLPDWVGPVAVLILLAGLVVVLATAWVQALPSTNAAEKAGRVPTDWQVAPGEALAAIMAGRIPHLTWGRAILSGAVALSLLFGAAGFYVVVTGGQGFLGPQDAGAGEAAAGIAVVPFDVTGGEDLSLWREGMVDLLATNLDGMGGFRTIDSRTVMARWRERVPDEDTPDLRTALEVAARTGARYAVVGAMVGSSAGMRLSADVYDLSTGDELGQVSQEGSVSGVLDLASALSVDLTRELMRATGQGMVQDVRLEALTTTSLPALRAYLEGEAVYRSANFAAAVAAYERAVELDSLFALAWLRLSSAYAWLDDINNPTAALAGERAAALVSRLPARDRVLVQASEAARTGDPGFFDEIQEGVRLYPDDPDLWFELGEYIYHVGLGAGVATLPQAAEAFGRAVALDPGFGPYQVHPLELTIASGDRAAAQEMFERYRTSTEDVRNITEFSIALPLLLGNEEEATEAVAASREMDVRVVTGILQAYINRTDEYARLRAMLWVNRDRAGADHQFILYNLGAEGALDRAARLTDSLDLTVSLKALGAGWMLGGYAKAGDTPLRALARPESCEQPSLSIRCLYFVGWGLARSGDLAGARVVEERLRHWADQVEGDLSEGRKRSADMVAGTVAAEEGRVAEARSLLAPLAPGADEPARLARTALAGVEWSQGNASEAIRLYSGNLYDYNRYLAVLGLARIYDARGDAQQARQYYRSFLRITREGDPDLVEVAEAREALERLGG